MTHRSRPGSISGPIFKTLIFRLSAEALNINLIFFCHYLCRHEFGQIHDEWMSIVKPELHPAVSAQLHEKFEVSDVEIENSKSVRSELRVAVNSLLKVIILLCSQFFLIHFDLKSIFMLPHSNFTYIFKAFYFTSGLSFFLS